jgi:hypothetical protein
MKAKNVVLAILFVLALTPTFAAAEDQTPKEAKNAISIESISLIGEVVRFLAGMPTLRMGTIMQYQRVVSNHFVLLATAGLVYVWPNPNAPQDSEAILYYGTDGWLLFAASQVEVDWHPFHKGLKGFYLGLSGIFNYTAEYRDALEAKGTSHTYTAGPGMNVGWQFLLPACIIMDLSLGIGYGYRVSIDVNGVTTSGFSFVEPRGGVFFGIRF